MTVFQKKKLYTAAVLAVGMGLGIALLVAKPKPEPKPVPEIQPLPVTVLTAVPKATSLDVKTQGTVEPRREIDVVAQVSGKVVAVADNFAEGGFFGAESRLVQIEDSDYRFALSRAEAKVAEAEQRLATEQGQARQARREWRELGSHEANDLFLRKPQLAAAKASLLAAKAERDQARLNLQRTQVLVPFEGRVQETFVDLGQYVIAGSKVAHYYGTDVVEVRLPLSDRQVALLDLPLAYQGVNAAIDANVTLEAMFGGQRWQWRGTIKRTDARIDVESRMVFAVAEIAQPFQSTPGSNRPPLGIGQFVQASIEGRLFDHVVHLPRSALQVDNKLWVVDEHNRLQQLPAKVLQSDGEQVVVQLEQSEPKQVVVSAPARCRCRYAGFATSL